MSNDHTPPPPSRSDYPNEGAWFADFAQWLDTHSTYATNYKNLPEGCPPVPKATTFSDWETYKAARDKWQAAWHYYLRIEQLKSLPLGGVTRHDYQTPTSDWGGEREIQCTGSLASGFTITLQDRKGYTTAYFHELSTPPETAPYIRMEVERIEAVDPSTFEDYTASWTDKGLDENGEKILEPNVITAEQQRSDYEFFLPLLRWFLSKAEGKDPGPKPWRSFDEIYGLYASDSPGDDLATHPDGTALSPAKPGALPTLESRITVGTTRVDQAIYRGIYCLPRWSAPEGAALATTRTTTGRGKKVTRTDLTMPVDLWKALKDKPAVVLKMWLAVEARRFMAAHPLDRFPITPAQLAKDANRDDRGYVSPALKKEVTEQLDALLAIEGAHYFPGKRKDDNGNPIMDRFKGPIYFRVGTHEVNEGLFGEDFIPQSIWLQRNPAFYEGYEGTLLRQTDHCTSALLSLNAKTDAVALVLGVYILCKARAQSHAWEPGEARFRVETLLQELIDAEAIGALESYKQDRNLGKVQKIVEKALDKLIAVGFLRSWGLNDRSPALETEDEALDSADSIIRAFPPKERKGSFYKWASSTVCLDLSFENQQAQALSRANKPVARKAKPKALPNKAA